MDHTGWSPRSRWGRAGGRGLALGREEFDREHRHFESGHTPLSCERPYSPWLAGWHPRAEAQRERELVRVKRTLKGRRGRRQNELSRKLFERKVEAPWSEFSAAWLLQVVFQFIFICR